MGIDLEIGSSPHSRLGAKYAIHVRTHEQTEGQSWRNASLGRIEQVIIEYRVELLLVDSIVELPQNRFQIPILDLPKQLGKSMQEVAHEHQLSRGEKLSSIQTARTLVEIYFNGKKKGVTPADSQPVLPMFNIGSPSSFRLIKSGKESEIYHYESRSNEDFIIKKFIPFAPTYQQFKLHGAYISKHRLPSFHARKEFTNLLYLRRKGISVPSPIEVQQECIVLSVLLNQGKIGETLAEIVQSTADMDLVYAGLDLLLQLLEVANFVHGDFSPHNIVVVDNALVLIDVHQGRRIHHTDENYSPVTHFGFTQAKKLLFRDLENYLIFFEKRLRVEFDRVAIKNQFSKWFNENYHE